MEFSIGMISFVLMLFGVFAVYLNFAARTLVAWYAKAEQPKDRVHFGAMAAGAVCFIIGGLMQPQFDRLEICRDAGHALSECIFTVNR